MDVGHDLPRLRQLDHVQVLILSGDVIFCSAADPVGLVQKEFSFAERRFGILVDSHDDCVDVMVVPIEGPTAGRVRQQTHQTRPVPGSRHQAVTSVRVFATAS
jgi:hypothetical protein